MSVELIDERNGLTLLCGKTVRIKLVCFFLENPDETFNLKQLANHAGVDRSNLYEQGHTEALVKFGIISRRNDGRLELNKQHHLLPLIKAIYRYSGNGST